MPLDLKFGHIRLYTFCWDIFEILRTNNYFILEICQKKKKKKKKGFEYNYIWLSASKQNKTGETIPNFMRILTLTHFCGQCSIS